MKKVTVLSIALMFVATISKAQSIPNGSFENWSNPNGYNVPDGWETLNDMTSSAGVYTATRGGTASNYYLKLNTQNVTGMGVVPAIATSGVLDVATSLPLSGFAYNMRPAAFTGRWQFMGSSSDDVGYIHIYLTKWNSSMNMRDTVALILLDLSGMQMTWDIFSLPFTYLLPDNPDSCTIFLNASGPNPEDGGYLYLDDLDFVGITAGIENIEITGTFSVYPNPSSDVLNFDLSGLKSPIQKFEIVDLQGKVIWSKQSGNNVLTNILISQLSTGTYVLKIQTEKGMVTQKFSKQ